MAISLMYYEIKVAVAVAAVNPYETYGSFLFYLKEKHSKTYEYISIIILL